MSYEKLPQKIISKFFINEGLCENPEPLAEALVEELRYFGFIFAYQSGCWCEGKNTGSKHSPNCVELEREARLRSIADENRLCFSKGPRIGSEGKPICKLPVGHDGAHRPAEDDGWGLIEWSDLL